MVGTLGVFSRKLNELMVHLPIPLRFGRQFASGGVPSPEGAVGKISFEQYRTKKHTA